MNYTYTISNHANSSVYLQIKNDIKQLFPDFLFTKENKETDDSKVSFYKSNDGHFITAELSCENDNIVVISDIRLTQLEKKYGVSAERQRGQIFDARQRLNNTLKTPMGIKAVMIPLCLLIIYSTVNSIHYGTFSLFEDIINLIESLIYNWPILIEDYKALILIPSVILTDWLAEHRDSIIYKLPLSLSMIVSELFGLILYAYDLDFRYTMFYFPYSPYSIIIILQLITILYILLLPILITDELGAIKREKIFGKRHTAAQSAAWWGSTAAIMLAIFLVFGSININNIKRNINDELKADTQDTTPTVNIAAVEQLLFKHEDEMRAVMDYSEAHNIYDWYCCPDESMKNEWELLFKDDSSYVFDYNIGSYDRIEFVVYIRNENGGNKYFIRFSDDGIYVNGIMYEPEGGNEI